MRVNNVLTNNNVIIYCPSASKPEKWVSAVQTAWDMLDQLSCQHDDNWHLFKHTHMKPILSENLLIHKADTSADEQERAVMFIHIA